MEISIQTIKGSWKGLTIIHYLSISFWAMVHSRDSTEKEADWKWMNSHLICVLGFGTATSARFILYKIRGKMINWWSFRQNHQECKRSMCSVHPNEEQLAWHIHWLLNREYEIQMDVQREIISFSFTRLPCR